MTGRFPTLWRIVEIPSGFAVEDATGQNSACSTVEPTPTLPHTPAF